MNINLTLIGQTITFAIFVWFCMKFIWPPIMNALNERKQQIADGLAAAERGQHKQELAEKKATKIIKESREQASEIIAKASNRGNEIVDEAKNKASGEADKILERAKSEIGQELNTVRENLRKEVSSLTMQGVQQILRREVNQNDHADILEKLSAKL